MFERIRRPGRKLPCAGRLAVLALVAIAALSLAGAAEAKSKYAAMVVDANTGKTLFSRNADAPRYPASLTKIMTLYIVFEELQAGRLRMSSKLKVSRKASHQAPSKLGLKPGATITVRDAIRALVTKSANDVAMVVAESISKSESRFARRMTATARRLGMRRTTFRNPHGLPNRAQRTTARDMITLGRSVQQHFPRYYKHFSTRKFVYRGRHYRNHNKLLGRVRGVDGIKTGYTRASGYNLVSSVRLGGRHIVAVVMGGRTGRSRNAHMRKLIKTYLPKARKGRRSNRALIAKSAPKPALAATAPTPRTKPDAAIVTASIAPAAKPERSPDKTAATVRTVKTRSISIAAHDAPDAPDAGATSKPAKRDKAWQIQIGAMPSKAAARALLERALSRHAATLARRRSYTMTVEKGGATLHRARFAGFASKSQAKAACSALKKRKFACYPLYE